MKYKCKNCGEDVEISSEDTILCPHCDFLQIVPPANNQKKITLYNLASKLIKLHEFLKAEAIYENICAKCDEVDAFYGLVLTKYGVSYENDEIKCYLTVDGSIYDDENYLVACDLATEDQLEILKLEAEIIDACQKSNLKKASKEKSYDISILVSDIDKYENDFLIASEMYEILKQDGKKVFMQEFDLSHKDEIIDDIKIYQALKTSKVVIFFCSKKEHLESRIVRRTLSRYIRLMSGDNNYKFIPCISDISMSDLPFELSNLKPIDISNDSFIDELLYRIDDYLTSRVYKKKVELTPSQKASKKAKLAYESEDLVLAKKQAKQAINLDPLNKEAYEIGILSSYNLDSLDELNNYDTPLYGNEFYEESILNGLDFLELYNNNICQRLYNKALKMKKNTKEEIDIYVKFLNKFSSYKDTYDLIDKAYDDLYSNKYNDACNLNKKGLDKNDEDILLEARTIFEEIIDYKDSKDKITKIDEDINNLNDLLCGDSYKLGIDLYNNAKSILDYRKALDEFMKVLTYKDTKDYYNNCKEKVYNLSIELSMNDSIEDCNYALKTFKFLGSYKESRYYVERCEFRIKNNDFKKKKKKK